MIPLENNLGAGAHGRVRKLAVGPNNGSGGFIHKALVKDLHREGPLDKSEGAFF